MSDMNHEIIMRGDIYYIAKGSYTGSEQQAGRPGIVVSNEKNNQHSDTVEVVFTTTKYKKYLPTHVEISSTTRASTALCEQVHTVSIERIGDYIGHVTDEEIKRINEALRCSLALNDGHEEKTAMPVSKSVADKKPSASQKQMVESDQKMVAGGGHWRQYASCY